MSFDHFSEEANKTQFVPEKITMSRCQVLMDAEDLNVHQLQDQITRCKRRARTDDQEIKLEAKSQARKLHRILIDKLLDLHGDESDESAVEEVRIPNRTAQPRSVFSPLPLSPSYAPSSPSYAPITPIYSSFAPSYDPTWPSLCCCQSPCCCESPS